MENLCQAYCADNGVQPTGIVNFTVAEQSTVNTQTTVTINAAILVAYTPKGSCRTVTKQWVEQFKVAFIGAAGVVPTISLTPLVTQVTPENVKCCNRAYGVSLATPLTISATFPAAPSA
ncbi:hypothetical protein [uncultured Parabacteroides sp.]|uniref:hypothetical protein n=1 Tax=uncultured Parabacteroides sp. TaxID=512312 RepID=UPI002596F32C|nr:hypothetical protein [uncultured Parabacteroides sp.]